MLRFLTVSCCLLPGLLLAEESGYRKSVFNGENLHGWHVTGCQTQVEDGNLVIVDGDGFVRTDHKYGDFVLELSWRPRRDEKWDSGIYIRCDLPSGDRPWPKQYQINLLQGDEGNLIGFPQGRSKGLVKAGEWNRMKLTARGESAAMEINGQAAWSVTGLEQSQGYIGIQCEVPGGGEFEFKDIYVTELDQESLFNGKDLAGWEGGGQEASLCWQVEDGLLLCTGEKGPWLRSKQEYDNFNFRLDYKLKEGGNSGVYVRVAKDGAHRDPGQGTEVQILDDAAERYKKLKAGQYCGSVYLIAAATMHVGRAPGEWNSMEIDCQGHSYLIRHNGTIIVDAVASEFPALKERRSAGFLGLQNHSEEVRFRDIRIGPSMRAASGLSE
ncbi:MAG: hypothetical protein CMJ64_26500 [Planctomycetaceae bacterium]|nr:hypothetical protein [Planctomycetaceae bacterium]